MASSARNNPLGRELPSRSEPAAAGFVDFLGGPPGKHALIGATELQKSRRWWTPLRVLLAVAAAFLSLGWVQKAQCLRTAFTETGEPYIDWSGNRQYTSACYSDTIGLFGSHGLDQLQLPYFYSWVDSEGVTRFMEYPVLTGLYQWLVAILANTVDGLWRTVGAPAAAPAAIYFGISAVFLALSWLIAVGLVARLAGKRVWDATLVAASPLVIVHAFTNFDLLAVLAAVAALACWANRRPGWSGVAVGVGVALKLWPAFVGGALILLCLRARAWRPLGALVGATAGTWLAVNLPFMLLAPQGWGEFFRLNSVRGWEGSTIYAVIAHALDNDAWNGVTPSAAVSGVDTLNLITGVALLLCLLALGWLVVFRCPTPPRVAHVVFLATLAFMITNKVWSPQYSIWLVPLLALAVPRWRLVLSWAALETVYWYVRMWQFLPAGQAAPDWLADTMTVVRLGLLVALAVIAVQQMLGLSRDTVREAHGGADPLAGVLAVDAVAPVAAAPAVTSPDAVVPDTPAPAGPEVGLDSEIDADAKDADASATGTPTGPEAPGAREGRKA